MDVLNVPFITLEPSNIQKTITFYQLFRKVLKHRNTIQWRISPTNLFFLNSDSKENSLCLNQIVLLNVLHAMAAQLSRHMQILSDVFVLFSITKKRTFERIWITNEKSLVKWAPAFTLQNSSNLNHGSLTSLWKALLPFVMYLWCKSYAVNFSFITG